MKKLIISLFLLFGVSLSQQYNITIDETGTYQLIILQTSITTLSEGDEIGVFDNTGIVNQDCTSEAGPILVAAGVWSGTQANLTAIGSVDQCSFGNTQLPGYVDGNPIIIKVFHDNVEYLATATYSLGDGTFGSAQFLAISELTLEAGDCSEGQVDLGCGCGESSPTCGTCDGSIVDLGCGCGNPAAGECGCDLSVIDLGCGCGEAAPDGC